MLGRPLRADEFAGLDRAFHDAYDAGFASIALTGDALDALASWTGTQSLLSMWFHDQLVPAVDRHGLTHYFAVSTASGPRSAAATRRPISPRTWRPWGSTAPTAS